MPQSSGQRHGLLRKMPEMRHSVSPRTTVWLSGALGANSDSGTPVWATWLAVARCPEVTVWLCAQALLVAIATIKAQAPTTGRDRRSAKGRADERVFNGMCGPLGLAQSGRKPRPVTRTNGASSLDNSHLILRPSP